MTYVWDEPDLPFPSGLDSPPAIQEYLDGIPYSADPVYRSLRELVMSYFEPYFNVAREKTLRAYTVPLSLARFDRRRWTTRDETMEDIATRLDQIRKHDVLAPGMAERLALVDPRSLAAGLIGSLPEGLWKVE